MSGRLVHSNDIQRDDIAAQSASPDDGDLSYEDALIDAQARYYFSVEYKQAEPSPDNLNRLLDQIEAKRPAPNEIRPLRPAFSPRATAAIYRAFSQPLMGRLLPSSVALMILVMLSGPQVSQLLNSGDNGLYIGPFFERTLSIQNVPQRLPVSSLELMIGEQLDTPLEYNPQDAGDLDPVELGVVDDTRRTRLQSNQRDVDKYKKSKFGPQ